MLRVLVDLIVFDDSRKRNQSQKPFREIKIRQLFVQEWYEICVKFMLQNWNQWASDAPQFFVDVLLEMHIDQHLFNKVA